jgi:hypothetical protein
LRIITEIATLVNCGIMERGELITTHGLEPIDLRAHALITSIESNPGKYPWK